MNDDELRDMIARELGDSWCMDVEAEKAAAVEAMLDIVRSAVRAAEKDASLRMLSLAAKAMGFGDAD